MKFVSLLKKLKLYTKQNPLVHSVSLGDIYENLNGKLDIVYGNVNFDIASVQRNDNLVNYNVYVYYTDRLLKDKSNSALVKEAAETVLNSIVNFASKELGDVQDGYTITFFEQQFVDVCAGGWVNFILEVPNELGDCELEEFDPDYLGLTLEITENGTYNVEEYTRAHVDVVPHWGKIIGDITEQEDLVEALNTKVDKSDNLTIVYGTDEEGNQITYTAGEGIAFENGEIKNTNTEAAWGNITGDIDDQTDLKNALDAKLDVLTPGANIEISNGVISAVDTIYDDTEIRGLINTVDEKIDGLNDFECGPIVPTTTNFVPGTEYTIHEALQRTANLFGGFQGEIDDINGLIPNQATTQNQLADKAFVNSTIATNAANFRGNWTNWTAVPSDSTFYPADYTGSKTPTNNDYLVVQDASDYEGPSTDTVTLTFKGNFNLTVVSQSTSTTYYWTDIRNWTDVTDWLKIMYVPSSPGEYHVKSTKTFYIGATTYNPNVDYIVLRAAEGDIDKPIVIIPTESAGLEGSWRFIYVGDWTTNGKSGWKPQYQIGTAFTAAQQAAIDSGITSTKVATYDGYNSKITALQTDKLDKVYTAYKIYGTNNVGQQVSYTAGDGIAFDGNQISTTFNIENYIHQGDNNIETDTPLYFNSEKDGGSYLCIRNDHAELVGKTLHKDGDGYFDRGIEYRISPDKVIFQSVSTDSEGNVESVNAEYKQTSKEISLKGEHVVLNSTNGDSDINVRGDIIKLSSSKIKNSANDIVNDVQNKFLIYQDGAKCVDLNKGGTTIHTRLDVFEPERNNSLRLKKDGFETIVHNSEGKRNWMKMTAGGNPFAFGVWENENFNDGGKTAFLNTLPDGNIFIYDVDGYDGITTDGHRSLQTVISDFGDDISNINDNISDFGDDISNINDNISDLEDEISNINDNITDLYNNKQDVLTAGEGIYINDNVISVTGGDVDIITKNAQIRVKINDCDTNENITVYVATSKSTYRQQITSMPSSVRDKNFDFDIQYTNADPLVKISVYSNTYTSSINQYTGFWLLYNDFSNSGNFNQDLYPIPLSLIPIPTSAVYSNFNGYYSGFSFQINLKDYDIDTDGRVEVCNVQTSTLCYAEDTLITLSDGTTKMVQDITYDDVLKVWNFDEGKSDSAKPIWIKVEQTAIQYALVTLSDGNSIKLVGSDGKYHCMYDMDEQKFNHAIDCIGHNVYTENGIVKVESLEIVNEPVKFYNIVTNAHLNCYANHILTSTEKNNIYPINDMKFIKDNRTLKSYDEFKDYGISLDEYEGWRLAEQPMSVEECVEFVKQRQNTAR